MIYVLGDIHGEFDYLPNILKGVPNDAIIIQVGDFGVYRELKPRWDKVVKELSHLKNPIYFIDGNHEEFPLFYDLDVLEPRMVWEKLMWIPRGCVWELEGLKIGFIGGAASPDKVLRQEGLSWWPQEQISYGEYRRLIDYKDSLDVLITHTPPERIVYRYFRHPSMVYPAWKLPPNWRDWSAVAVEDIWDHFKNPQLFCGHFHASIKHENVRILDINEIVCLNDYL